MKNNRKNIDELFKSELGSYTETPPPAAWDALEKRLGKVPENKPRTPYTWFGYFAVVAVLVVISVVIGRNIGSDSNPGAQNIAANNGTPTPKTTGNNNNASDNTTSSSNNTSQTGTIENNTTGNTTIANNNNELNSGDTKENQQKTGTTDNGHTANKMIPADNDQAKQRNTGGNIKTSQHEPRWAAGNNKHSKRTATKNTAKKGRNIPADGNEVVQTETQQRNNVYNSSGPHNDEEENTLNKKEDKKEDQAAPNKDKKEDADDKRSKNTPPPPSRKIKFNRFELGIKGGYESGFDNDGAKKAVISPYLQYKISSKFAIMLQPSVKSANVTGKTIGNGNTYYKVNQDGTFTQGTDSIPVHVIGTTDSFWIWNYSYTQTHDSIIKTYTTSATYIEFEIPILLKYYVAKDFSVYGGVNIAYSKLVGIREQTYTSRSIPVTLTGSGAGPVNAPAPPLPANIGSEIMYTGTPITAYTGPQYPAPKGSLLRFGYMIGFSYEYEKKWLFDALIQQSPLQPNVQGGYNVNTPLSVPYFRLTVGYKLIK